MKLVLAVVFGVLCGCAADVSDVPAHTASENGLSLNKLSLNKLSLNKLSLNKLSLNGLGDGLAGLEQSEDGREVLKYLAICALPEGDAIEVSVGGTPYRFEGRVGLAPEWKDGACDRQCQRWVSACLAAHGNGLGISVPISLRGHHPALRASAEEVSAYPVQEGAFYGNLFDGQFDVPIYICTGDGIAHLMDPVSDLRHRLCGVLNDCPITDAGACRMMLGDKGPACLGEQDGEMAQCHVPDGVTQINTTVEVEPPTFADLMFDEVITVYLQK